MLKKLVKKNRSYRRFQEDVRIPGKDLEELIDLARYSASSCNLQPLRYYYLNTPQVHSHIFPSTKWAGYLKNWKKPKKGERPPAYIIILYDTEVKMSEKSLWCDIGLAGQNILLGAVEKGYRGCLLGNFKREELNKKLKINHRFYPMLLIALGKPAEKVVLKEVSVGDDITYYRDKNDIHTVPKYRLEDILINKKQ